MKTDSTQTFVFEYTKSENKLIKNLLIVSLGIHIFIFAGINVNKFRVMKLDFENEIEVDFGSIGDSTNNNIAAIKDSKVGEDLTIPDNMLPQLPKVVEQKQIENKENEAADEDATTTTSKNSKKDDEKNKKQEKKDSSKDNELEAAELQKRLALERLRSIAKKGKELRTDSDKSNLIAKNDLKGNVQTQNAGNAQYAAAAPACAAMVRRIMKNHYYLPPHYYIEKPQILVSFSVVINDRGDINQLNLTQGSGDQAFDEIVKKAIESASPFPEVCYPLAGAAIEFKFSPQNL